MDTDLFIQAFAHHAKTVHLYTLHIGSCLIPTILSFQIRWTNIPKGM